MEDPMSDERIPQTDSIQELARFWDTHDLTDFDDELEEVTEPVFERKGTVLRVPLTEDQARALVTLAQSLKPRQFER